MKIKRKSFGTLSTGEEVDLYILKAGELSLSLSTYGGTLVSLIVPSRQGKKDDVLLGFSTLDGYTRVHPYFGATIGRFGNRIAKGRFVVDGRTSAVTRNEGENTLHGGRRAFDRQVWGAESYTERNGVYVRLTLDSPDGEEGFPGDLHAVVTYGLTGNGELLIDYKGRLSAPCPLNFTNHAYFNLKGEGQGDILGHELELSSAAYIPVGEGSIPTGEIKDVAGSPFDFRKRKPIGKDIGKTPDGYDHCYVTDGQLGDLRPCAEVFEPTSGRSMKVLTTQPGVQLYTGNYLAGIEGKSGSVYNKHAGFCLETQHYPDSPNQGAFPSSIYGPDRKYHEQALFGFDW